MKKSIFFILAIAVCLSMLPATSFALPAERKIVVFEDGVLNESARDALIKKFGGEKIKNLDLIGGKVVLLPPHASVRIANEPGVLRVDDDAVVTMSVSVKGAKPAPTPPAEQLPWGVNRIDAELVWSATTSVTGAGVKVAVIDTGIDLNHPDLMANIAGGYNAINPLRSAEDDNGHGTHVAGIIGAVDNSIGVIGVAPQAKLFAVKVLDRRGSGYISDIIEGLDWSIQNGMQVANMSLGLSADILSFHEAVIRAHDAGITLVAAAGNNSGGAVDYPGAYPEVIAVSATDSSDSVAYFSSVGPQVALSAPGASIYSTYKGDAYKIISGTSMASPHVAGVVALLLSDKLKCDADLDGVCSPLEVLQKLEATAEDLGSQGFDNFYGAGLVDAESALR